MVSQLLIEPSQMCIVVSGFSLKKISKIVFLVPLIVFNFNFGPLLNLFMNLVPLKSCKCDPQSQI